MIFMLFNILLNSYILGTITLVVIKADETTSRQRRGYEKLERFARKHSLSPVTANNLKNHLKFNYLNPEIQNSELLENLPSNLRRKVMIELYSGRISRTPPFRGCTRAFIASLLEPHEDPSQFVHSELFMTADEIISQDEHTSCLYVILHGSARLHQTELSVPDVFPVEPFLDMSAIGCSAEFHVSPYTVRANSTCRVLCIPSKILLRSFAAYPADREAFCIAALDYAQKRCSPSDSAIYFSGQASDIMSPLHSRKSSIVHFDAEKLHWPELEAQQSRVNTGIITEVRSLDAESPLCADTSASIEQMNTEAE